MIAGVAVRCQKFRMPRGSGGGRLERARRVGAVWNDQPGRRASGLSFAPPENPDAAESRVLVRNRGVFDPVREISGPASREPRRVRSLDVELQAAPAGDSKTERFR